MDTANVDKLLETVKSFIDDLEQIKMAVDIRNVSLIERRAVNKLQLAQVEVEMAGRDLYNLASARKIQIRRGDLRGDDKSVNAGRSKSKTSGEA